MVGQTTSLLRQTQVEACILRTQVVCMYMRAGVCVCVSVSGCGCRWCASWRLEDGGGRVFAALDGEVEGVIPIGWGNIEQHGQGFKLAWHRTEATLFMFMWVGSQD